MHRPYRVLVDLPEGKRPLWRPRRIWEDNIKMNLKGIRYEDVDSVYMAQDRDQWCGLANTIMNLHVP
jgi:hypothetical protein